VLGTLLIAAAVAVAAWTVLVWQWQDPLTAVYTKWEQHRLAGEYDELRRSWDPPRPLGEPGGGGDPAVRPTDTARDAAAYRRATSAGEAIGRIRIPRLGLDMVLVNGTADESLRKGPGRDERTFMPGEHRLVYIAGHRTTYLAPFSRIDEMRVGDRISIDVPYGRFVYRMFRHEIVPADDLAALDSPRHELLRLQACHPRFFATERYLVDARLVRVERPASNS